MKYLIILLFSLSISFAQSPTKPSTNLGENPVFFIDSLSVAKEIFMKFDSNRISSLTVVNKNEAIEMLGDDGKDGAVYIETKEFCKKRYWTYFSSKSSEYSQLVASPFTDENVQYILNDRVLKSGSEGILSLVNDRVFKSITFISKEELQKKYEIEDKDFGFLIESETPKNLYNGDSKF